MAPVKQNVMRIRKGNARSKKSKAQLAISQRWKNLASSSTRPIEPIATSSNSSSPEEFTVDQPSTSNDKYTNIRKANLNVSETEIEREVGLGQSAEVAPEYLLVDINSMNSLVEKLCCPECFECYLVLNLKNKVGFCTYLCIECENCQKEVIRVPSSRKLSDNSGFDVNRRVTKAFMGMSKGHSALEQFSLVLNMAHMSKGLFQKTSAMVHKLSAMTGSEYLAKARKQVRDFCKEQDPSITDSCIIDLAVSYDGSWHKRGFTSNYGVGSVIHIDTGLVIDFCVLSKYCLNCAVTKEHLGEHSPEFYFWYQGHKAECDINYRGSSPAMEVAAADYLWKRSLEYNFRYTTVVSDGDSKVFSHLKGMDIYGEHVEIVKEECINHVSKRLGTALRKLVKDVYKAEKVTLGGKAFGGLTEKTISKLTKYYHNAISENVNKDVKSMKDSILGTLYHCISTDQIPKHFKCPQGEHSWCFYNRAIANKEIPGPHSQHMKTHINNVVLKYIVPIYKRLSDVELLKKCLRGLTQNSNESLHSHIWRRCDKAKNSSKSLVETAVIDSISEYNFGSVATIRGLKQASLIPGATSTRIAKMRDRRRRIKVEKAKSERLKRRRHYLRLKNINEEESRKRSEGVTYGPGEF